MGYIIARGLQKCKTVDYEDDLCEPIIPAWENAPLETLRKLASSIPKNYIAAVEKKGRETGYQYYFSLIS